MTLNANARLTTAGTLLRLVHAEGKVLGLVYDNTATVPFLHAHDKSLSLSALQRWGLEARGGINASSAKAPTRTDGVTYLFRLMQWQLSEVDKVKQSSLSSWCKW